MQPFLSRVPNGDPVALTLETRTDRQHLNCVTVVQGNRVVQISAQGIEEARGPLTAEHPVTSVCLTFDTEDGHRFFRVYEYRLGTVNVTTSPLTRTASWEDNPDLGIVPSRLAAV